MRKFCLTALLALQGILAPVFGQVAQKEKPEWKKKTTLVAETFSIHSERGYNEFNPGIGFEYTLNKRFHAGAGIYYNSLGDPSVYALTGVETNAQKKLGVGAEFGLVTGYISPLIPAPALLPYVRVGQRDKRFNLKVNLMPPVKDITPAVMAVQVRMKLVKPQ